MSMPQRLSREREDDRTAVESVITQVVVVLWLAPEALTEVLADRAVPIGGAKIFVLPGVFGGPAGIVR